MHSFDDMSATKTHVNERFSSTPNAVDLAHTILSHKCTQLRGYLMEAKVELRRVVTERELFILGEVDLGWLSTDHSGCFENKQVIVEGGVEFAGRETRCVLCHH